MAMDPVLVLAATALTITALLLLVVQDWRISIIILSLQYTAVFLILTTQWTVSMAATKLIAGWISGAVLGMAMASVQASRASESSLDRAASASPAQRATTAPPPVIGLAFVTLAAAFVLLALLSLLPLVAPWFPKRDAAYLWGGLVLLSLGALKLGFTNQPFQLFLALLTTLAGFEILYAALESSVMSAGLLATVNLGLALVGAYLLTAPFMEEGG